MADARRWQVTGGRDVLVEEAIPIHVRDELAGLGHQVAVAPAMVFGGAQAALATAVGYVAATESRKDGVVAGY